ncbi:MAG: cytochrome c oxidase subunit II [Anaerolineae bacterium]|nr:cytochrome c oxidase subunit II [Anaerolineae bacterium]
MRKYKHALAVFLLIILSTVAFYILFRFVLFRFPAQASAEATVIDNFADIHFWMQAFLFSIIMVIMMYAVFAFRRQPDDESEGPHVHGHTGLEIIWTIVPTAVVIGFAIYSVGILNSLLAPEAGERTIEVVGRQWSWQFIYPDIERKSNTELGLLVDQPVVLHMRAEDVIHSFWVPEFRVKQDLLPAGNPDMERNYLGAAFYPHRRRGVQSALCGNMWLGAFTNVCHRARDEPDRL